MNCDYNTFSKVPIVKGSYLSQIRVRIGGLNTIHDSGQDAAFTWRAAQARFKEFIFLSLGL
jgi:hypothetical protein